jgi:hypothetical protein
MTTLANRPATALLVIDVQNRAVTGAHQRDAVVANIESLVEKARREHVPVIWIQHSDEQLKRGSGDWQIVPELNPDGSEPHGGRPRPSRSSRTRTCTGPTRRRPGGRPGRSRPRTSISPARPNACACRIRLRSTRPSLGTPPRDTRWRFSARHRPRPAEARRRPAVRRRRRPAGGSGRRPRARGRTSATAAPPAHTGPPRTGTGSGTGSPMAG